MRILLIGNYVNNRQESMQRFAELINQGLIAAGHEVKLVRPPAMLGRVWRAEAGLDKWIGYIDRFLFFPTLLRRQVDWADVVHICDQANAVYLPHLHGKPHLLTCHDIFAIRAARGEIPESPTGWTGRIYQRWILSNLKRAKSVACVSRQTRDEVLRVAGLVSEQVEVVPNTLNYPYRPMASAEASPLIRALGLEPEYPFFLHVGGNQWYKNRPAAIRIFAKLASQAGYRDYSLVMAGKPWTDSMRQMVKHLSLEQRVIELVDVSNRDLRALYSVAKALIYPSLQEGFGWPIAEAQACGCVVATTNRPPMNEVGGEAAIYFDPADEEAAARSIVTGLKNASRLRVLGLDQAAQYSLEAMIRSYLHCYREAIRSQLAGAA